MTPKLWNALWGCVSKTEKRLDHIGLVGSEIVASTGEALIAVFNHDLVFPFGCKRISYDGKYSEGSYPNISGVFIIGDLGANYFTQELITAAELVPKSENIPGKHIALDILRLMIYPPLLRKVLEVFKQNDEKNIEISAGKDRIQLEGRYTRAVVMALMAKDGHTRCKECYTLDQLLDAGDLL